MRKEVDNFFPHKVENREIFRVCRRNHIICLWFQLRKGPFFNQVVLVDTSKLQYFPGQIKFSPFFPSSFDSIRQPCEGWTKQASTTQQNDWNSLVDEISAHFFNAVSIDELKLIYFRFDFNCDDSVLRRACVTTSKRLAYLFIVLVRFVLLRLLTHIIRYRKNDKW